MESLTNIKHNANARCKAVPARLNWPRNFLDDSAGLLLAGKSEGSTESRAEANLCCDTTQLPHGALPNLVEKLVNTRIWQKRAPRAVAQQPYILQAPRPLPPSLASRLPLYTLHLHLHRPLRLCHRLPHRSGPKYGRQARGHWQTLLRHHRRHRRLHRCLDRERQRV
jgi:hypothetical protein